MSLLRDAIDACGRRRLLSLRALRLARVCLCLCVCVSCVVVYQRPRVFTDGDPLSTTDDPVAAVAFCCCCWENADDCFLCFPIFFSLPCGVVYFFFFSFLSFFLEGVGWEWRELVLCCGCFSSETG